MGKLSSKIKNGTYENIFVDCPYCRRECIFNRISDLKTVRPITGQDLKCEYCEKIFWASCDRVTPAKYRWFLSDLPLLKKNKTYGLYIFALCQACEMFMDQAIINKLIDTNPAYRDNEGYFYGNNKVGADAYNEIYQSFCDKPIKEITNNGLNDKTKYKKCTFDNLRNLFLHVFDDARKNKLPSLKKLKEDKREEYFCVIENTEINRTRNNIVHKYAYRPSFCDVQKYDELTSCLSWMGIYLDVKDLILHW
jgi:hypothetical protein